MNASTINLDFPDERRTLHEGCAGTAVYISRSAPNAPKEGYANTWEIALPLSGIFLWKVGNSVLPVDSNSTLFISPGQTFGEKHPIRDRGHAATVVVPAESVLDEVCSGRGPYRYGHFQRITHLATPCTQMLARQLCQLGHADQMLEGEELTIAFLQEVFSDGDAMPVRVPNWVVTRAKELLQGGVGRRISLAELASEVGVTPTYLTQAFKRSEGIPLYKYQLRLRLAAALNELPHCDSIVNLALELGFSSHSHFSTAFYTTYNLSPSEFREKARSLRLRTM